MLQVIEPAEVKEKLGLSTPHTSHCLGSGEIMISAMGDAEGNAKGGSGVKNCESIMTCMCPCI